IAKPGLAAVAAALAVAVIALAGAQIVYRGYALSLDEFMATFDAAIFRHGRLAAPIDPQWRPFADGLQPIFRLRIPGNPVFMSTYLPVNAAIRAAFDLVGAPALANALLAGVAVIATYGVGRRLWPERPDAAVAAAV